MVVDALLRAAASLRDDAEALAAAINRVLVSRETALALAQAGHDDYLADYSEAVVVQRYLDFFAKVAGNEVTG